MRVRRLCWLGVRTEAYDETTAFFRDVLGLSLGYEETGFSMFALPDADRDFVEVFSPERNDLAAVYAEAPVVGLLVDDLVGARDELAAAGVELIDEIQSVGSLDGYRFFHIRGPDRNVALAVQLEEEHTLPLAEAELPFAHGDRLAGRAEEHGHAVGVAVADLHILLADVLGAPVPVVVRVVVLGRDESLQENREVLEEAALPLVDPHRAGRVW